MSAATLQASKAVRARHDFVGLLRLMLGRSSRVAGSLLLTAFFGVALAAAIQLVLGNDSFARNAIIGCIALTQVPLMVWCLFGFDWSTAELDGRGSSIDPFLVRSPISSMVLASVPILCKWLGIALSLGLIFACLPSESRGSGWLGFASIWITLASISLWASAFVWRPFRQDWHRVVVALVLAVAAYGLFFFTMSTLRDASWAWLRLGGVPIPAFLSLVTASLVALDSMRLARVYSSGLPQRDRVGLSWLDRWSTPLGDQPRSLKTELAWYDRCRMGMALYLTIGFVVVPMMVMVVLMKPLAMFPFLFVLAGVVSHLISIGGWADVRSNRLKSGHRRTHDLLAVSSISMERLATEKALRCIRWSVGATLMVLGMIAFSMFWPEKREAWWEWAAQITVDGEAVGATGMRASIAMTLLMTIGVAGVTLGNLWLTLLANDRAATALTIVVSVILGAGLAWGLYWVVRQSQWDDLLAGRDWLLAKVPAVVVGLVAIKAVMLVPAFRLAWSDPRHRGYLARVIVGWMGVVFVSSALVMGVLPVMQPATIAAAAWLTQPNTWLVIATVVSLVPLSRVLILPWAMAGDVHR